MTTNISYVLIHKSKCFDTFLNDLQTVSKEYQKQLKKVRIFYGLSNIIAARFKIDNVVSGQALPKIAIVVHWVVIFQFLARAAKALDKLLFNFFFISFPVTLSQKVSLLSILSNFQYPNLFLMLS